MNKTTLLWIGASLIFLVIFNALFFVIGGTEHAASVWVSYGFIHFAYAMLLLTPFLVTKGKSEAIFRFSLYYVSVVFFAVTLIAGVAFMGLAYEDFNIVLLTHASISGVYVIILIYNIIANRRTADAEEKRQYQIAYVKDATAKLARILKNVSDTEAKKNVERLYDVVNSSPVRSYPSLSQSEERIIQDINELEGIVSAGDNEKIISAANALLDAVNDRNAQLKLLNP